MLRFPYIINYYLHTSLNWKLLKIFKYYHIFTSVFILLLFMPVSPFWIIGNLMFGWIVFWQWAPMIGLSIYALMRYINRVERLNGK